MEAADPSTRGAVGPVWGRLGLVIVCSTGCPDTSAVVDPVTSDDGSRRAETTESDGSSGDASSGVSPFDELGRLLTGPGLCQIVGGDVDSDGVGSVLSLVYDSQGRPELATTELTPNCAREEPDPSQKVLGLVPRCHEDIETQTLRWVWNADDALTEVEHTLNLELGPDRDPSALGDRKCLAGDEPFMIERDQWRYDTDGRVIGWTQTYADCEGAEIIEETLRYGRGVVDVTRVDPIRTRETHFELDARGHVAVAGEVRHGYDELGRLVATTLADGTSRRWSYEASLVAEHDRRWTQSISADKRTITLEGGVADRTIVIVLDGAGRPETLSFGDERWSLEYGDCPNADRASARWLVHAVFDAWPFPDEPELGEALEQREVWIRRELPLRPF